MKPIILCVIFVAVLIQLAYPPLTSTNKPGNAWFPNRDWIANSFASVSVPYPWCPEPSVTWATQHPWEMTPCQKSQVWHEESKLILDGSTLATQLFLTLAIGLGLLFALGKAQKR